jgi:AbrB family looped-hinge helix DNA binding protein
MQTTLTSKGQVTIPRDVRQHFGLTQGMAVTFEIKGDHIALRPARTALQVQSSGAGLIKSRRKGMPVDLDMASLVTEAP